MSHVKTTVPSIVIIVLAVLTALIALGAVVSRSSSVDITRPRLERDVAHSYANQYVEQQRLLGKRASAPHATAKCTKGGPTVADQGPGKDWVCAVSWTSTDTSDRGESRYEVGARTEACYTATDPKLTASHQFVRAQATGKDVDNPLYQFDGCFNVN